MRDLGKQALLADAAAAKNLDIVIRQLDVEQTSSVEACIADMMATEGRIDVLVNNAGAGFVRSTEQATEDEIRRVMDVNFMGVVRCTKAVMPHMRAAASGHIVNISSVGGLVGQPFNEIYCAAKFAVEGYTEAMASYLEEGFGIRLLNRRAWRHSVGFCEERHGERPGHRRDARGQLPAAAAAVPRTGARPGSSGQRGHLPDAGAGRRGRRRLHRVCQPAVATADLCVGGGVLPVQDTGRPDRQTAAAAVVARLL